MSKPRPCVAANWKCNGTLSSTVELINVFNMAQINHDVEVVVAPTLLHIGLVQSQLRHPKIKLAAQNCTTKNGAFTGEVSIQMLRDAGVDHVILGHSERRAMYGETDEVVATKVFAALEAGMTVLLCCGELKEHYDQGRSVDVVITQLNAIAAKVTNPRLWSRVKICYEPIFAIGTGLTATPEHAHNVHSAIRNWLGRVTSPEQAASAQILYGGSATAANSHALYGDGVQVNGFLVGGASLKPQFVEIINSTAPRSQL